MLLHISAGNTKMASSRDGMGGEYNGDEANDGTASGKKSEWREEDSFETDEENDSPEESEFPKIVMYSSSFGVCSLVGS